MSESSSELNLMPQEETKFPEGSRIVPINPASKYIMLVPQGTSEEKMDHFAKVISEWWSSDNPFFIMTDEIVLVDISKADVITDSYMTMETPEEEIIDLHSVAARKQIEEERNAEKE